jgi:hypothetical protein
MIVSTPGMKRCADNLSMIVGTTIIRLSAIIPKEKPAFSAQ